MKTQPLKPKNLCFMLLAFSFLLTTGMQCKKDGKLFGKDELPPITQEGKNVFGFLLNDEIWVPKGPLLRQILDLSYDPSYKGGSFNIIAKRYFNDGHYHHISMGGLAVSKTGIYDLFVAFNAGECYYEMDTNKSVGTLNITKIDLANKFISGTFEFTLENEGCPTITATEGRFDLKIE